jgi:signal transduction histidine kinase
MNAVITEKRVILYIEDDPASRRLVERTLRFSGFDVLVAERGLEGIDLARRHQPNLILTDINLPDLSGQEIAAALRHDDRFKATPIVALTAQSQGSKDWEMALAAGVNGYITKPVNIETLVEQLEFYLKGGQDFIDEQRRNTAQINLSREVVSRLEKRIRELETLNKELIQLDKMKDTFIQLTAHELRTPLTLVFGYSRLLADHPPLQMMMQSDSSIRALIEGLSEAIERMQGIIEAIVIISRIMSKRIDLSLASCNMSIIVRKALKQYTKALQDRRLTVHFDATQWPNGLRGDSELLQLLFSNLLSNAIKFTPDGGDIYFEAKTDDVHLRFSIKDTGIGIDKTVQKHIFERFHTVNDVMLHSTSKTAFNGGGLGLGLSICKGIVEAHCGQIWVESECRDLEKRPGSQFTVLLPLVAAAQRKG